MVVRKKKKMKSWLKILLSFIGILLLIGGGAFSYTFYQLGKVQTVKISRTNDDLGIKPEIAKASDDQITNIAFFGLDRRNVDEPGRSDSIIIISVDEKHKKIKMSSVMRDTYVSVNGHGQTKINHAYAYGGPQL